MKPRSSFTVSAVAVDWINFQSKAFSIMPPAVWNYLSSVTKSSATITTFKAHLKTELFAAVTFLLPLASPIQTRQTMPPINVFDIDIDIVVDNANDDCVWTGMQSVCRSRVSQCTECSVTRTLIRHHHCYHHHWL